MSISQTKSRNAGSNHHGARPSVATVDEIVEQTRRLTHNLTEAVADHDPRDRDLAARSWRTCAEAVAERRVGLLYHPDHPAAKDDGWLPNERFDLELSTRPIAAFVFGSDGRCRWLLLDLDPQRASREQVLRDAAFLAALLALAGVPWFADTSVRGGVHIYALLGTRHDKNELYGDNKRDLYGMVRRLQRLVRTLDTGPLSNPTHGALTLPGSPDSREPGCYRRLLVSEAELEAVLASRPGADGLARLRRLVGLVEESRDELRLQLDPDSNLLELPVSSPRSRKDDAVPGSDEAATLSSLDGPRGTNANKARASCERSSRDECEQGASASRRPRGTNANTEQPHRPPTEGEIVTRADRGGERSRTESGQEGESRGTSRARGGREEVVATARNRSAEVRDSEGAIPLAPRVQELLRTGLYPEGRYPSDSEAAWDVLVNVHRAGWTGERARAAVGFAGEGPGLRGLVEGRARRRGGTPEQVVEADWARLLEQVAQGAVSLEVTAAAGQAVHGRVQLWPEAGRWALSAVRRPGVSGARSDVRGELQDLVYAFAIEATRQGSLQISGPYRSLMLLAGVSDPADAWRLALVLEQAGAVRALNRGRCVGGEPTEWLLLGAADEAVVDVPVVQPLWTDVAAGAAGRETFELFADAGASLTRAEVAERLGVSPRVAGKRLASLVRAGLAVEEGTNRHKRWRRAAELEVSAARSEAGRRWRNVEADVAQQRREFRARGERNLGQAPPEERGPWTPAFQEAREQLEDAARVLQEQGGDLLGGLALLPRDQALALLDEDARGRYRALEEAVDRARAQVQRLVREGQTPAERAEGRAIVARAEAERRERKAGQGLEAAEAELEWGLRQEGLERRELAELRGRCADRRVVLDEARAALRALVPVEQPEALRADLSARAGDDDASDAPTSDGASRPAARAPDGAYEGSGALAQDVAPPETALEVELDPAPSIPATATERDSEWTTQPRRQEQHVQEQKHQTFDRGPSAAAFPVIDPQLKPALFRLLQEDWFDRGVAVANLVGWTPVQQRVARRWLHASTETDLELLRRVVAGEVGEVPERARRVPIDLTALLRGALDRLRKLGGVVAVRDDAPAGLSERLAELAQAERTREFTRLDRQLDVLTRVLACALVLERYEEGRSRPSTAPTSPARL